MRKVFLIILVLNLAACADMRDSVNALAPRPSAASEMPPSERLAYFENRLILWLFVIVTYPFAERR